MLSILSSYSLSSWETYISGKQKAKGALQKKKMHPSCCISFGLMGFDGLKKSVSSSQIRKLELDFSFHGVIYIQFIYYEIKRVNVVGQLISGAAFQQNCSCRILTYDSLFLPLDSLLLMVHFLHMPNHRTQFAACSPCVCVLLSPLCPRAGHMAHKPVEESTANPSLCSMSPSRFLFLPLPDVTSII